MQRVILVRCDEKLGEILLATPVCQALKESKQVSWIEVWGHPKWIPMIQGSPWIDSWKGFPFRPSWRTCWQIAKRLKQERPDAILILRPNSVRYSFLAVMAGVPKRGGIATGRLVTRCLLTHLAHITPAMHQVERNLAVAEIVFNRKLPRCPLHFAPAHPAELPPAVRDLPVKSYAVIHLGTGGVQPRWLPERFAAVANFLAQKYQLLPVLSGATVDLPMSERCKACAREPVLDLTGKLTVLELAEVLRRARLLVSVDTGVVHLAAAVGTPCVSLHFRLDYPPHQWYAWQVPHATVVPTEYCAGCTLQRCQPHPTHCVASLYTEQVIAAIKQLISNIQ